MTRLGSRKPVEAPQPLGRVESRTPAERGHLADLAGLSRSLPTRYFGLADDLYPDQVAEQDKRALSQLDRYLRSGRDKDAWLWAYGGSDEDLPF